MTVWVLSWDYDWEWQTIVGVYDNEAMAEAELQRRRALPSPHKSKKTPWGGGISTYELNTVAEDAPDYQPHS